MRPSEQPEHWYKPGTGVRFSLKYYVQGALTDSPTLSLTLHFEDGTTIVDSSPTRDSRGVYHSDQVIPRNVAAPSEGVARWEATGLDPSQNMVREKPFGVLALAF